MPSKRVLDVGGNVGIWAEQFAVHGCDVLVLDAPWIDKRNLRVPRRSFRTHDLRHRIPKKVREWGADLTVCIEVAEHLPASRGPALIKELCSCSDRLLFSAAYPGQGGHLHINERPAEYWIELLEDQGFAVSRRLQREFRLLPDVAWWYTENLLMAVRVTALHLGRVPGEQSQVVPRPGVVIG
jgi:hypothetical protein